MHARMVQRILPDRVTLKTPGDVDAYGNPTTITTTSVPARVETVRNRNALYTPTEEYGETLQADTTFVTTFRVTAKDTVRLPGDDQDRKVKSVEYAHDFAQRLTLYRVTV